MAIPIQHFVGSLDESVPVTKQNYFPTMWMSKDWEYKEEDNEVLRSAVGAPEQVQIQGELSFSPVLNLKALLSAFSQIMQTLDDVEMRFATDQCIVYSGWYVKPSVDAWNEFTSEDLGLPTSVKDVFGTINESKAKPALPLLQDQIIFSTSMEESLLNLVQADINFFDVYGEILHIDQGGIYDFTGYPNDWLSNSSPRASKIRN